MYFSEKVDVELCAITVDEGIKVYRCRSLKIAKGNLPVRNGKFLKH